MTILGIDYGRRRIGLAVSLAHQAIPYKVLIVSSWQDAFEKIAGVAEAEGVDLVVVGVSEGEMEEEEQAFAAELERSTGLKVKLWNETLTTRDAAILAREAGLPRKRRKDLIDAYAAALMLQSFLEAHGAKKKGSSSV